MSSLIAKNTLYLTSASVGQKFFSFVYFTLIARLIGVENTGLYVTALSFSSLFSIFTDLGLTPVLIREGAKDNQKTPQILGNILMVKLGLAFFAYLFLNVTVYLTGYAPALRGLILISGLIMVLDAFSLSFYGALRSFQNLRIEAVGVVATQLVTMSAGLAILFLKGDVKFLLLAMAVGSLFNAIWGGLNLARHYQIWPRLVFDIVLLKKLAVFALPFALAGIFTKIYSYIDVVLLSRLLDSKAVGWYSVPSKITFAFQFIPMAFSAALYPAMSKFFVHDKERLKIVFEKGMIYLAMLALPISFGLMALGETVVIKIYGPAYQPSVLPLKILLASLIFAFLDFPIGALLNACHRQTVQTVAMGFTMLLNIVLNLILIPKIGIMGAAVSALAGNFTLFAIGFLCVPKIITLPGKAFWRKLFKNLLAAGIMGGLVSLIQPWLTTLLAPEGLVKTALYLGILVAFGAVVYLALLWFFRLITKTEIKEARGMFQTVESSK